MMSAEERSRLQQESERELTQLRSAHNKQKRDADTVTDEMFVQVSPRPRPDPQPQPQAEPEPGPEP
jgi:hypothetical protein